MKITFFYAAYENLGIEYLSAALKAKNHTTELVFSPSISSTDNSIRKYIHLSDVNLANKILATSPGLVAFSIMSDMFGRLKNIATLIKQLSPETKILCGGIHPTSRPQLLEENTMFDYLCVGEGEEAIVELADALEKNQSVSEIKNIWAREENKIYKNDLRPLVTDIDTLPFPDKDLFLNKYPLNTTHLYMAMTGRGCPFNCSYCYNSFIRDIYPKNYLRRRSVGNVIEEMREAQKRDSISHALFVDDTFTYDKNWLNDFCLSYQEQVNMPFMCQVHARYTDEKTISLLEKANCERVLLGIQTLDQTIRDNVINRRENNKEIAAAINLINKSKLSLCVTIMHELPTQTEDDLKNMAHFFAKNPVDGVLSFKLRYYPKIKINQKAIDLGHIPAEEILKMEQSDSYLATIGPSSQDKGLLFLISISSMLSPKLIDFAIKYKLYKIKIPLIGLVLFIYWRGRDLVSKLLNKKQTVSFIPIIKTKINQLLQFIKYLKSKYR